MSTAEPSISLHVVPGVKLFATGTVRGETWTEADVDAIVRNAHLLADYLKPTVVLGHEEDQPFAEGLTPTSSDNTGQPSFGVIRNVRKLWAWDAADQRHKPFPVGDFHDVPGPLYKLLKAKAYRTVSAELYDDAPPEGFPDAVQAQISGPVLRRVALLGGEIPQCKTIGEVMDFLNGKANFARFAELPERDDIVRLTRVERNGNRIVTFSEVIPVAKTTQKPKPRKKFSELPLYKSASATLKATLKKFDDMPVDAPPAEAPPEVNRQELIAALGEMGVDVSVLTDAVPDDVLVEMIRAIQGAQAAAAPPPEPMSEPAPAPPAPPATPPPPQIPANAPSQVILKYTDSNGQSVEKPVDLNALIADGVAKAVDAKLKTYADKADAATTRIDRIDADTRRASIEKFCDAHAAKIGGGDRRQTVIDRLMRADHLKRFSDGPHKGQSELDLQMDEIANGPDIVSFSERMKNKSGGDATEEEDKVRRWAEQNETTLKAAGKTVGGFVQKFSETRKHRPELTAAGYCGARE